MSPRLTGLLLIVTSAISFGTLAIFARLAYSAGASPTTVLLLRFTIAGAVMAAIMVVRRQRWPRGRTLLGLILMGGVGYVGQSFAYFTALLYASAGLVALLLYLYPALVSILAVIFLHERLTARKLGAIALALLGTYLTIGALGHGEPLGIILGASAAVIYSIYILVGSRITPHAGAIPASTVIILAAAVVYAGIVAVQHPIWPATVGGWAAIVAIAIIPTVVAILTFFAGMERIGPTSASTLSTLEPVVTVALAAVILSEALNPLQLLGGALILMAVLILARAA